MDTTVMIIFFINIILMAAAGTLLVHIERLESKLKVTNKLLFNSWMKMNTIAHAFEELKDREVDNE